jgi:hypothetical protein
MQTLLWGLWNLRLFWRIAYLALWLPIFIACSTSTIDHILSKNNSVSALSLKKELPLLPYKNTVGNYHHVFNKSSFMSDSTQKVFCQCSQCSQNTFFNSASQQLQGRYVSSRNRRKHQDKDLANQLLISNLSINEENRVEPKVASPAESIAASDVSLANSPCENEKQLPLAGIRLFLFSWSQD